MNKILQRFLAGSVMVGAVALSLFSSTGTAAASGGTGGSISEIVRYTDVNYDYVVIGNSESYSESSSNCNRKTNTQDTLSMPSGSYVVKAYLFWSGTGYTQDPNVTLNGSSVSAQNVRSTSIASNLGTLYLNAYRADVTNIVTGNGTYTFGGFTWNNANPYCSSSSAYGGWTVVVIYSNATLPKSNIVLSGGLNSTYIDANNNSYSYGTRISPALSENISVTAATCNQSTKLTNIWWDGDNYKGEDFKINNQQFGSYGAYNTTNNLNGYWAPSGRNTYNLDVDTYNISVPSGTSNVNVLAQAVNLPYSGYSWVREWTALTTVIAKTAAESTCKASIGDFVWNDLNNNGIQNSGEPGISGVTVRLLDTNNNVLLSTATNSAGWYQFSNLTPGSYKIQWVKPSGYNFATPNASGSTTANNSDADQTTGISTVSWTLAAGANMLDADAGLVQTAAPTPTPTSAPAGYCPGNLILNPSFENDYPGNQPAYWSGNGTSIYEYSGLNAPDGSKIAYTVNNQMYYALAATPGKSYRVTFYVASHVATPAKQYVRLAFYSASNSLLAQSVHQNTDNVSALGTLGGPYTLNIGPAPAGTTSLRVEVYDGTTHYVKVDAFCLVDVSGSPTPTNTPVPPTPTPTKTNTPVPTPTNTPGGPTPTPTNTPVGPTPTPLPPSPTPVGVLTVNKHVVQSVQTNYTITLVGPSYPAGQVFNIVSGTNTIAGLIPGVYSIVEQSPGAGWVTTYTVTAGNGIAFANSAVVTLTNPISATSVSAAPISGKVFNDYNSDGNITSNGTITETGVQGVTVTAYDVNGNAVGSTTSNSNGDYSFTPSAAGPWRLEFTNLPAGYQPSRVSSGTQNGTSVQFVNTSGASNMHFGIVNPADYSGPTLQIATSRYHNGVPSSSNQSLLKWSYTNSGDSPAPTTLANANSTGSTWGQAYARSADALYSAAFVKRHVGLYESPAGTPRPGQIFRTTNARVGGGSTSAFFDVGTVSGVSLGTVQSNSARGLGSASSPNNDASVYDQVGKVGLGGLDLSDDETMLWTVSLNDRQLLGIPTTNPTSANVLKYSIPNPSCSGGSPRPFAVKFYRGQVYVGIVCDASTSQSATNLVGYVSRFNPNNGIFTTILTIPLNYTRLLGHGLLTCNSHANWLAWSSAFPPACGLIELTTVIIYPQPILSDIEFDVDGSMILGFMDRMAHQGGNKNYGTTGTTLYGTISSGDVLRAHNNNGTYQLENNGNAGTLVGQNGTNEGPGGNEFYDDDMGYYQGSTNVHPETGLGGLAMLPGSQTIASNAYDPLPYVRPLLTSGVIFMSNINGDKLRSYEAVSTSDTVQNFGKAGSMGDIELLTEPAPIEIGNRVWWDIDGDGVQDAGEPGLANVAVTLNGPDGSLVVNTNASGNYYHSQSATTGAYAQTLRPNTAYTITVNPATLSEYTLTAPNAQGAYDHNAFSDIRDSDAYIVSGLATIYYRTGNAGENNHGLDFGFTKAPAATVLITNTYTIKASIGDRVWQDNDGDGVQDNNEPGLPGVTVQLKDSTNTVISTTTTNSNGNYTFSDLQPGNYTVVFVKPANYDPSPKDSPSTTDALDSDADPVTGQAPVTLLVSEANDTTDAGFVPFKGTIGDRVWLDADQNGQQNSENGVENVTVRLINSSNIVISTTTTNSGGGYQFAGLNPGTYYVEFVLPGGYSFTTKDVGNDLTDSDAITTTGRTDAITLTPGQVNNSIDAGLIQINGMCIGNLVFGDANENGVFDGIDPRVANRRVRLYTDGATNTELASMLTNSQGEYQFCGLAPGNYIVAILPADVPGFYGSPSAASANSDVDNDNNGSAGTLSGGVPAIRTTTITLVANAEPTTEDGNNNTNLTIDIGMWKE